MRRFIYLFIFIILVGIVFCEMPSVMAATPTPSWWVELIAPGDGEALQGVVAVTGKAKGGGLQSVELSFAYPTDKTGTRFFLADISPAEAAEFQVEWDTTVITDGEYDLRLRAVYANGEVLTQFVSGVRVRNYTPLETETPSPTEMPLPTGSGVLPSETVLPSPTLTPLPPNPAAVKTGDIFNALGVGLAIVGGLFALLGIYTAIRKTR